MKTPATWWDAFKLRAIEQGNPIFDPAKINYTVHVDRKTVRVEVREAFRPNFVINPDDMQRGYVVNYWLKD